MREREELEARVMAISSGGALVVGWERGHRWCSKSNFMDGQ